MAELNYVKITKSRKDLETDIDKMIAEALYVAPVAKAAKNIVAIAEDTAPEGIDKVLAKLQIFWPIGKMILSFVRPLFFLKKSWQIWIDGFIALMDTVTTTIIPAD